MREGFRKGLSITMIIGIGIIVMGEERGIGFWIGGSEVEVLIGEGKRVVIG